VLVRYEVELSRFGCLRFLEWIIIRVGACPTAAWLPETVTGQTPRTAVGDDTRRLFGQETGRVNDLSFQGNFFTRMLTIGYLDHFPISISHRSTSI
jgi:hypothetical protein